MKVTTCIVLLGVAVAISATRSKHHAGQGRNTEDNRGKGRRPGQQIGSPDDASTSRSFSKSDRGSRSAGSVLGGAQALHNGQEGRYNVGSQTRVEKQAVTNIESRDIGSEPPADTFRNMGISEGGELALNARMSAAPGVDVWEELSRAYKNSYRRRGSDEYDSRSIQEEGQQNGRRSRQSSRRGDDSRSSEDETSQYRRSYQQRYAEEDASRSSEEYRPRRTSARSYPRRGGDYSKEDPGRTFGQRRRSAFEGFDRSG